MKNYRHIAPGLLITALALGSSSLQVQAVPNFVVAAFATGTQGENNSQDGSNGQYAGDNLSVPYGAGTIGWDGITFDAADGSTGSAHITANFSGADNTDLLVSMAPGYNNWYFAGSSASCPSGTVDFTQYHAVQFDILWDTNSTLTIDQFNTGNNWPLSYLKPGEGSNFMATNNYFTDGVNVELFTGNNGGNVYLGTFKVPANAASGWQTVTLPYSDTLPGISSGGGLWFQGSFGGGGGLAAGPYTASFWIDNLILVGNQTVSGPPTVTGPTPATPGLNIFNAGVGTGSFPYSDRNEVVAKTTSGLSWVGHTPTTYTMNLTGFPNGVPFTGESYLFLIPNASAQDQAPDYNESAAFVMEVQGTTNGAQSTLSYKVNNAASETYSNVTFTSVTGPSATTNLTAVLTASVTGNYSLTFTGNDAGTLTAPDGTVGTFTLPANLAETYFTEGVAEPGQSNAYPFLLYLGGQANDNSFINKPTVYGSFTVTGPPNAALATENFINDANTGTPLQNWGANWPGNSTTTPAAVTLVPTNAPYWISWTLPASGFVLADGASLQNKDFVNVSTYSSIPLNGVNSQLISKKDLVDPKTDFFAMVHRTFSQLLVLLPGQTNTPGVAPGYAGTPTPLSMGGNQYVEETVTVMAVDSQWNPIGAGITDGITLSSSTDGSALVPGSPVAMSNGTVTFDTSNPFFFGSSGSETVTATDTTNPSIPAATSAAVTVTP